MFLRELMYIISMYRLQQWGIQSKVTSKYPAIAQKEQKISGKLKIFKGRRVYREKCAVFTPHIKLQRGSGQMKFSIYPLSLHNLKKAKKISVRWGSRQMKYSIYPAGKLVGRIWNSWSCLWTKYDILEQQYKNFAGNTSPRQQHNPAGNSTRRQQHKKSPWPLARGYVISKCLCHQIRLTDGMYEKLRHSAVLELI